MRNEQLIKSDLEQLFAVEKNILEARDLFATPGGDRFVLFLRKAHESYAQPIEALDATSPQLGLHYLKLQFVRSELTKLINLLKKSQDALNAVNESKLALNKELKALKDETARREKNRM